MSSVKSLPVGDFEPCRPCASASTLSFSAGAVPTRRDSSIRCSTTSCSAAPGSCASCATASCTAPDRGRLGTLAAAPDYARRFTDVAARVASAGDPASVVSLLKEGARALGADHAVFISFVREAADLTSCRITMACDPVWCQQYLAQGCPARDPWLAYATRHAEPVIANSLAWDEPSRAVVELAARHGFRSVVLAPAHAVMGQARISVLVLGSEQPDFFDDEGFGLLRIGARMLAGELHDWWLARVRRELLARARLTAEDIELLRYEQCGLSSKHIALELGVSVCSINSRFQRLNVKLGVLNRRQAVRLAVECRLLPDRS